MLTSAVCEGILLEENSKKDIKVIDFGLATHCKDDEMLSETIGTVAYMVCFICPIQETFCGLRLLTFC